VTPRLGKYLTLDMAYPAGNSTLVADPTTDQAQAVSAVPHTSYTLDGSDRVLTAVDPDGNTRTKVSDGATTGRKARSRVSGGAWANPRPATSTRKVNKIPNTRSYTLRYRRRAS